MTYGANDQRLSQMMTPESGADDSARAAIAGAIGKTYFQSDYLGSVLFADNAEGEILRFAERDSWGDLVIPVLFDMNTAGVENSLQFTNHHYDPVVGKYFAQARFYDAETGRFMAKDPIKSGVNLYPYAKSNPTNFVDPNGELWRVIAGIGSAVVGGVTGAVAYLDEQKKSGEKFSLGGFTKTVVKAGATGTAKVLASSFSLTAAATNLGSLITDTVSGTIRNKGDFGEGASYALENFLGIDRESMFPPRPKPAGEVATAAAVTSKPESGKVGSGFTQAIRGGLGGIVAPYRPRSVTESVASSVRPSTKPSSEPMVSERDPKVACADGSAYGEDSAGPVKSKPGSVLLDVAKFAVAGTAIAAGMAVAGYGAFKLFSALKPVGKLIGSTLLSGARGLFGWASRKIAESRPLKFGDNDLVYGPSAGRKLAEFSEAYGGKTLTSLEGPFESGYSSWEEYSIAKIEETVASGNKIHFDLTHMEDTDGPLNNTGEYANATTSHELRYIRDNWQSLRRGVQFYRNGMKEKPPWLK
jgi:RHS repeat-associated protein